jgi:hypothetical protein
MLTPEQLQLFCATEESAAEEWKRPFSWRRWTIATSGKLLVRIARRDDVAEAAKKSRGRMVMQFLERSFPKKREVNFVEVTTLPQVMRQDGIGRVQIGAQFIQERFLNLVATLPGVRIAILRNFNPEEDDGRPIAFVFGNGEGLKADGVGLIAPLAKGSR